MSTVNPLIVPHNVTIDPAEYLGPAAAAKLASVPLTGPPSGWVDDILQHVLREHPYLPADRLSVVFRNRDDGMGNARGYVSIAGAPKVTLPIIIANRRLKPVDLILTKSSDGNEGQSGQDVQFTPLSERSFQKAMDSGEAGGLVDATQLRGTGYSEDGSNLMEGVGSRGRIVVASVADRVGASDASKDACWKVLTSNKKLAAAVQTNCADVVDSWLNAPAPVSVQTKLAGLSVQQAAAEILPTPVGEAVKSAEFTAGVVLTDSGWKKASRIDVVDLGVSDAKLASFLLLEDGTCRQSPEELVVDKTASTEDVSAEILQQRSLDALRPGQSILLWLDGAFSRPAKIASVSIDHQWNATTLRLNDGLRTYQVLVTPHVKVAMQDPLSGSWLVPAASPVLSAASTGTKLATADDYVYRMLQDYPCRVVHEGGLFSVRLGDGHDLNVEGLKEASARDRLSIWLENADQIIDEAKTAGLVSFRVDLSASTIDAAKKIAAHQAWPDACQSVLQTCRMSMEQAIKLAASAGDPEAAATLLGTGFLDEDNIGNFLTMSSDVDKMVERLARLLLLIRQGLPGNEVAVSVAIKALQRVQDTIQTVMSLVPG